MQVGGMAKSSIILVNTTNNSLLTFSLWFSQSPFLSAMKWTKTFENRQSN